MDKDDESDNTYLVSMTNPTQVPYGTFTPLDSSSSSAPGHVDKKLASGNDAIT